MYIYIYVYIEIWLIKQHIEQQWQLWSTLVICPVNACFGLINQRFSKKQPVLDRFAELVAGIEWFAEARQLSDTSAIWLDLAAYRHGIAGEMFRPEPGWQGATAAGMGWGNSM